MSKLDCAHGNQTRHPRGDGIYRHTVYTDGRYKVEVVEQGYWAWWGPIPVLKYKFIASYRIACS